MPADRSSTARLARRLLVSLGALLLLGPPGSVADPVPDAPASPVASAFLPYAPVGMNAAAGMLGNPASQVRRPTPLPSPEVLPSPGPLAPPLVAPAPPQVTPPPMATPPPPMHPAGPAASSPSAADPAPVPAPPPPVQEAPAPPTSPPETVASTPAAAPASHAVPSAVSDVPAPSPGPAPISGPPTPGTRESGESSRELMVPETLLESADLIRSSNLVTQVHFTAPQERLAFFQTELEVARRMRREKMFDQAKSTLTRLLRLADTTKEIRRNVFLELALVAQQENQPGRAQQIYAQYLREFPEDPSAPEILLRKGLVYRQMGASTNALNAFFSVLSSALVIKYNRLEYYQNLVLQAQTEIADTYYQQGNFADAAYNFSRLLKLEAPQLNRQQVRYKLILCLARLDRPLEVLTAGLEFLQRYPRVDEEPEVRYTLASAYKRLGRNAEAMEQVVTLLASENLQGRERPEFWSYWQQRAANDIANQLYREGDCLHALEIYRALVRVDSAPSWRLPALYQVGLVLERLQQPAKAAEVYDQILAAQRDPAGSVTNSVLGEVVSMAQWRRDHLVWRNKATAAALELQLPPGLTVSPPLTQ